jgi:hypothetical protein
MRAAGRQAQPRSHPPRARVMASARGSRVRCRFACRHPSVAHVRRRLHRKPPRWSRVFLPATGVRDRVRKKPPEPRAEPDLSGCLPDTRTRRSVRSTFVGFSETEPRTPCDRSGPRAHACRLPVLPGFRHETVTVGAQDFFKHVFESMWSCNFGAGLGGCDPNRRLSSLEAGRQPVAVQRRDAILRSERQASRHAGLGRAGRPNRGAVCLSGKAWTRHEERRPDGRC